MAKKPATTRTTSRLEMRIVSRSEEAANAINTGNTRSAMVDRLVCMAGGGPVEIDATPIDARSIDATTDAATDATPIDATVPADAGLDAADMDAPVPMDAGFDALIPIDAISNPVCKAPGGMCDAPLP